MESILVILSSFCQGCFPLKCPKSLFQGVFHQLARDKNRLDAYFTAMAVTLTTTATTTTRTIRERGAVR
ncbi:MAG: hypothetical protein KJ872_05820 [Alphaproteobacteria bacterium]|nr:hypothetical protein [Alphaproteobacteria bacterium]